MRIVKQKKSAGKDENCKGLGKAQRSFGKEDFYENEVKRQQNSGKAELCEDGVKRREKSGKTELCGDSVKRQQATADGIRREAAASARGEEAGDNLRATRERMRAGSARRENDNHRRE